MKIITRRGALAVTALAALIAGLALPPEAVAYQFNATIRGKVVDEDDRPLAGVKITITKLAQDPSRPTDPVELVTGEDGEYYARNVSLGEHTFVYQLAGYETFENIRELRAGPVRIDVTLRKAEIPEEFVRANVANEAYAAAADAFNAGNYAETVSLAREAREALEDVPDSADALGYVYALLGAAYSRQRMFDEAVDAFERRLELQPAEAAAHLELAQALADSGDEESAGAHFEAALALDPDNAMTRYNVGVTMVNAGSVEAGIVHIERAIELQPVYPLAYKSLGYAYAGNEQYQKAIDAFQKYLEQSPEAADAAEIRDFIALLKEMIGG
jgi:tetratricopeptide (TPR) repeat protein